MRLRHHPDSQSEAVTSIDVEVLRADALRLRFVVNGRIGDLVLPAVTASGRADELWRHTCFEAFVRAGAGYYEFNVSPSTQWAAYRFDGYRRGMRVCEIPAPSIEVLSGETSYEMQVTLDLPDDATGRFGLAAVIEEKEGRLSYWALAHPPGKPDFHHSDCFALELPPAWRP